MITNKPMIFKELDFVYIVNGKKFLNKEEAELYSLKEVVQEEGENGVL